MFSITRDHRRISYIKVAQYLLRYIVNRLKYRFKKIGWPVGFESGFSVIGADCVSIGNSCYFNKHSSIHVPEEYRNPGNTPQIIIEDKVTLGPGAMINALQSVTIRRNVLMAANVYIADHGHAYEDVSRPIRYQGVTHVKPVLIKENAWLGINCVINPGVTVGKNSVIGANSVVTRDVPDFSVAVGSPARVVKQYNAKVKKWIRTAAAAQLIVGDIIPVCIL